MAAPKYHIENAYSYYAIKRAVFLSSDYEVESPETKSEMNFKQLFSEGKAYLFNEEYSLALDSFRELQHLILKTVNPALPSNPFLVKNIRYAGDIALLNPLMEKAGKILTSTPVPAYNCPRTIINDEIKLSPAIQKQLAPFAETGFKVTSYHRKVEVLLNEGMDATLKNDFNGALKNYEVALKVVPQADTSLRASLLHDMAILNEKVNNKENALKLTAESIKLFEKGKDRPGQVLALSTLSGIQLRSDKKEDAEKTESEITGLVKKFNLHSINPGAGPTLAARSAVSGAVSAVSGLAARSLAVRAAVLPASTTAAPLSTSTGISPEAVTVKQPTFMALNYLSTDKNKVEKVLTIQGSNLAENINIAADKSTDLKAFYDKLSITDDIGLLQGYGVSQVQMVAYIPHLYFFILPMAIGDCYKGLGSLAQAESNYLSVLQYPYINQKVEIIKVWTRLAEVYLEMGDNAYKNAADNAVSYEEARKLYERIIKSDGSIDVGSPLYKDAKFNDIKKRITDFLSIDSIAIGGFANHNENPQLMALTLEARKKLFQINAGLNYFGIAPDYTPPFSFEYLQNTARYFAQQASEIEGKYIQFKSTAENEELRYEQISQQVELAQQTVILENRGVAEAQAGIGVSAANVNYTQTQVTNAKEARDEFDDVRWELLEYSEAEAWANASSVDGDDQVKLTWNGNYYSSSKKKRNEVIKDLAYRKTRITHDMQATKLDHTVESAEAYKKVAEAQLKQAEARKAVAEQRVEIARLQQKQAAENKEFLDLKEFGAALWYDMAQTIKRIARKYLDMATEISVLMERAYNAESERGLKVIRYNYSLPYMQGLLGADQLLRDIDYFTYDYITNIKTKKAPVKKTISMGDAFPVSLQQLIATGKCQFKTELADFDREYPGMYLCKIKNVELLFVGITKAASIAGTLRNTGVSAFRNQQGTILSRMYPADIMPLSQYDIRQDALAFRFDPKDLKLFENNGIETIWELQLGRDANDFNFNEILDIQLVLYYDGFFNPLLETSIKNALPANGAASRAFSLKLFYPDELFYLKNSGEAVVEFSPELFPYNQTDLKRIVTSLVISGDKTVTDGLKLKLHSEVLDKELTLTANKNGKVAAGSFKTLKNKTLFDKWTIRITAGDNPHLVEEGKLNLGGLSDLSFMTEYAFKYRS